MTSETIVLAPCPCWPGPAAHRDPWSLAPSARAVRLQSGPVTAGTAPETVRLEVGGSSDTQTPRKIHVVMWYIATTQVERGELEVCSLQLQQGCFLISLITYHQEKEM